MNYRQSLQMTLDVANNKNEIIEIKYKMNNLDEEVKNITEKIEHTVMKNELSPLLLDFRRAIGRKEYVFMNGQPMKASEAYIEICSRAEQSLFIIDNYVGIKTLRCLRDVSAEAEIIIFSDNVGGHLRKRDYEDFRREFPDLRVRFIKVCGKIHDRFIILDYSKRCEKIYHCGASIKDTGNKVSAIGMMGEGLVKDALNSLVAEMMNNPELKLK